MDTNSNSPALVDASAVAGITIPPGTGSFLSPARLALSESEGGAASPAPADTAAGSEDAAVSASEAPQAASNDLVPASAAPAVAATPAAPLPAQTATAAPAVANTTAVPASPRFVGGLRQRRYALDYPIEYAGRVYDAITLRRPTSAEVGLFFEHLAVQAVEDPSGRTMLPVFVDDEGEPIPDAVIDFLDGADDERIGGAVADFLPPRLQRFQAELQSASTRPPGASTEATS